MATIWRTFCALALPVKLSGLICGLVFIWTFFAYFPGFLHGDSQVRWVWAQAMAGDSDLLDISNYFHPLITLVYYHVLNIGLPVWFVHLGQVILFYSGFALLVQRLIGGWWAVVATACLCLPPLWNFSALQSTDSMFLIGCLWYLFGFSGILLKHDPSGERWKLKLSLNLGAIIVGSVLIFCSRYNASPLILPFVVAPILFRLPWTLAGAVVLSSLAGPLVSKVMLASMDLPEAYKLEMMMATDVVGVWKNIRYEHPEARPLFWDAVPNEANLFAKYDPHNQRPLAWTEAFFRAKNLGPVSEEIRETFWMYVSEYPEDYWPLKLKTLQNPWGFVDPFGRWYYKPAPRSYMEFLGIDFLTHQPVIPAVYTLADKQLKTFYSIGGQYLMRPWVWWLVYLSLLIMRLIQRRTDHMDALVLFVCAGYFLTLFIFSNGFLLRYFMPVFILAVIGSFRLIARRAPEPIIHSD